jgi:hypothetical protein
MRCAEHASLRTLWAKRRVFALALTRKVPRVSDSHMASRAVTGGLAGTAMLRRCVRSPCCEAKTLIAAVGRAYAAMALAVLLIGALARNSREASMGRARWEQRKENCDAPCPNSPACSTVLRDGATAATNIAKREAPPLRASVKPECRRADNASRRI